MHPARSSMLHRGEKRRAGQIRRFVIPIMRDACTLEFRSSIHKKLLRRDMSGGPGNFKTRWAALRLEIGRSSRRRSYRASLRLRGRHAGCTSPSDSAAVEAAPPPLVVVFRSVTAKVYHVSRVRADLSRNKAQWAIREELCRNCRLSVVDDPSHGELSAVALESNK